MKSLLRLAAATLTLPALVHAQDGKPDAEGFLRDWLVLAPFPIDEDTATAEIDRLQFTTEAQPDARADAVQKIGPAKALTWTKTAAAEFYLDFKALYPRQSENAIAWAVAYVVSAEEQTGLTLHMNSNDQGKAYLNGKELVKFTDTRVLDKNTEDTATGVTLKKGVNTVVLKVINQENNWQGSLRFLDASGRPVTDLKIATAP
jgi:hypothetical protein